MALNINLPNLPNPVVVAEVHGKLVIENGKVALHVTETAQTPFGPVNGPPINVEIDPLDALHVAAVGISGVIKSVFEKK